MYSMVTGRKRPRYDIAGNEELTTECEACSGKLVFERFRPRDSFGRACDSNDAVCKCQITEGVDRFQSWYIGRGHATDSFKSRSSILDTMTIMTVEEIETMVCYPTVMDRIGRYADIPVSFNDENESDFANGSNILVVGHRSSLLAVHFGARYVDIAEVKHGFTDNKKYDVIILYNSLCRATNLERKLRVLRRTMPKGGKLVVVESDIRSWEDVYSLAFFEHAMKIGYGTCLLPRLNMHPLRSWKGIIGSYFTEVKVDSPKGEYREFIGVYSKE